jgi:hypothetical protein
MMKYPDKKAFKKVCTSLAAGETLTLEEVGDVFGPPFLIMLVYAMMDAGDAARAIQGAIARLSKGEKAEADAHP